MADGVESNRDTEGACHPFAINEEGQARSAFSVVARGKGQTATANSDSKTWHRNGSTKPRDASRTQNDSEGIIPYNHNFPNTDVGRMGETSSPRVVFHANPQGDGVRLRADAIGPGVVFDTPPISSSLNWAQKSSYNGHTRTDNSDGPLRRRSFRPNVSASRPNVPSSMEHSHTSHANQRCSNSNSRSVVGIRHRLTNDLELLSRPSWCDANFAHEQVVRGKANGNRRGLWFRSVLHRLLFRFGCFAQRRAWLVLIVCVMVMTACCALGFKLFSLETDVEKLWVESGGVLEKELEYTQRMVANGMETTSQILIQTGEDTATVESLKLHLAAAVAATKVTVTAYDQDWELSDVCYKALPDLGETSYQIELIVGSIFPCLIMGPLDCFFEGSELLGPSTPVPPFSFHGIEIPSFTWKTLNPKQLLELFGARINPDVKRFNEIVTAAGVEHGYQNRWCLDPHDSDCPDLAPNKASKELPDVKAIIQGGCEGYATKYMRWPNDLIVGGVERDEHGNITRARGFQTLIQLMGPANMYNFHKNSAKVPKWSLDKATTVLTMFQRQFVQEMYKVKINSSSFAGKADEIHAFAPSTTQDLILEFSNFSVVRVAAGYIFMLVYACVTMLRCKASRSQGAVGVIGVLLVALSVMAGLGVCSIIGIKFNAATTQVLPFLMLGLGVDDMFLIAHQFGEIACLNYIPFEERTGECMKRVGISVLLTSIAILSGFCFAMIIPMPALRSFAIQASIITCFNLLCVLIVFPATLSIDLRRRRKNRLDIFCCVQSSSANDVIELSDYGHDVPPPRERPPPPVVRFTTLPAASHHHAHAEPGATITMHHTIQAYSDQSYVTFLGPAADGTFGSNTSNSPNCPPAPDFQPPLTPPPRYTPDGRPTEPVHPEAPPAGPRQAFHQQNTVDDTSSTNTSPSVPSNSKMIQTHSSTTPTKPKPRTPRAATSNLVTPMESVRSSTHSLVPAARSRASNWFGQNNSRRGSDCTDYFPLIRLSALVKKHYGPFLMKTPVKVTVLAFCGLLLGGSVYGCLRVRDGLDLVDILPRDTREHDALSAQLKYFSFYNMFLITKEFDYAHKQRELHMFHQNISDLKYVVRNTDGTKTKFWMEYMRDWLTNLQTAFDHDWSLGHVNETTWKPQASDESVMAFKLLLQTGKPEETTDFGRIGCAPPHSKPCAKVNIVRLVSDDGIIREDGFYNYLTAWSQNDPLAYLASQAQIVPTPATWESQRSGNLIVTRSKTITYAQMPYYFNDLRDNEDFVDVIKSVRSLCDHYELQDVYTYPSGYPFLFWQQYIDLRRWLFVAMGVAILGISAIVALALWNPWAGCITCLFLLIISTELLGFMGIAGVKLSAVPALILVAAVGLGVEFTVHVILAFITSCGSRDDRTKSAISHMMGPVVDGAVSTFLGVVVLSGSEFDFVVRYFFQVLAVLVLIGLWNGIVLLPVVLSLLGPPPEVIPRGGGNRLKTPTPPPTPVEEEEDVCPNCNNNSRNERFPRVRQGCHERFSSRDDQSYMQRPCTCEGPCYPPAPHRYPHRFHHPMDPRYQCQVNPGYSHPHSAETSGSSTPRGPTDDRRYFVYFSPEQARMQHCDSPAHASSNQDPAASQRGQKLDDRASRSGTPWHSSGRGQHIATVTSSFTVQVRQPRQHPPVYLPPTVNTGNRFPTDSPLASKMDSEFQPIANHHRTAPNCCESGANFSESIRNSPNVDEASEAVDSAFQKLGNSDVTG